MFVSQHDVNTGCHPGLIAARLRHQRLGRIATILDPSVTVSLERVTDTLASLHWLHIQERIKYQFAVLTYKVLHVTAKAYLGPLVRVTYMPCLQTLRSAGTNRLVVSAVRMSNFESRAFAIAKPVAWKFGIVCGRFSIRAGSSWTF